MFDDLRDFIDPDEGYRDIDWDSHLNVPEAFYADSMPCESCGKPVDGERRKAKWDDSLMIGPCCEFCLDFEFPDLPVCDQLWKDLDRCRSVEEVQVAMEAHRMCCEFCQRAGMEKAA